MTLVAGSKNLLFGRCYKHLLHPRRGFRQERKVPLGPLGPTAKIEIRTGSPTKDQADAPSSRLSPGRPSEGVSSSISRSNGSARPAHFSPPAAHLFGPGWWFLCKAREEGFARRDGDRALRAVRLAVDDRLRGRGAASRRWLCRSRRLQKFRCPKPARWRRQRRFQRCCRALRHHRLKC